MAPRAPARRAGAAAVTAVADRGRCGGMATGIARSDPLPSGQGGRGPLVDHGLAARRRDLSACGGRPTAAAPHPADGLSQVPVLDEALRFHTLEDLAPSLPALLHLGYLIERLGRGGRPRAQLGIED